MSYVLIRQRYVDHAQWRRAFDEMAEERERYGLRTVVLARNQSDPDEVVVVFEVADPARFREYVDGDGLRAAWKRGGVVPESNQVTLLEPL